jgi:hypothetical protein
VGHRRFILSNPTVSTTIIGMRKLDHVLRFRYQATALLTSALAPWWYSTRLGLIHHGQELAVQLLPRNSHSLPRI